MAKKKKKSRGRKKGRRKGKLKGKAKAAYLARMAAGKAKKGKRKSTASTAALARLRHALSGGATIDRELAENNAMREKALRAFSGGATIDREEKAAAKRLAAKARLAEKKYSQAMKAFSNQLKEGL